MFCINQLIIVYLCEYFYSRARVGETQLKNIIRMKPPQLENSAQVCS